MNSVKDKFIIQYTLVILMGSDTTFFPNEFQSLSMEEANFVIMY